MEDQYEQLQNDNLKKTEALLKKSDALKDQSIRINQRFEKINQETNNLLRPLKDINKKEKTTE